jgi:hypothetical protein
MDVQLAIPFETLVQLVAQLPAEDRQALIKRVQVLTDPRTLSAAEKIALLESAVLDVHVSQVPSTRREDWYDDSR